MRRVAVRAAAAAAAVAAALTGPAPPVGPVPPGPARAVAQEDLGGLPAGPGREEVFYLCGACHSIRLVQQQGLSRARWDELLAWMVEKQGMPEPPEAERDLILDYLAEHYGPPDDAGQRAGGEGFGPLTPLPGTAPGAGGF